VLLRCVLYIILLFIKFIEFSLLQSVLIAIKGERGKRQETPVPFSSTSFNLIPDEQDYECFYYFDYTPMHSGDADFLYVLHCSSLFITLHFYFTSIHCNS